MLAFVLASLAAGDPTSDWLDKVLGPGGALVLALVVIFGAIRKWWVPGWVYADVVRERDMYREMALKGVSAAEKLATVVVQPVKDGA